MTDRLPPHNHEAEQAVIGGILIDNDAFYDVPALEPEYFYEGRNGQIFKAIRDLLRSNVPADFITVTETLKSRGVDEPAYLIGLLNVVPTAVDTRYYGDIVIAHARRRELIQAAGKIATAAFDEAKSINTTIETAQAALFEVTDKTGVNDAQTIKVIHSDLHDVIAERKANGGKIVGIPTGYIDLDRILGGLKKKKLYVLSARPGMGKSALESAISLHAASLGCAVARFNLEMDSQSVALRMVSSQTNLNFSLIERGELSDNDMRRVSLEIGKQSELSMWIDDTPSITPQQLHSKCRRLFAENGKLDLITVDYLGLMRVESKKQNRTQEVGEISRSLKKLAKDLDVPVLALSQLSRSCEARADKRPMLSDLRDSGDIEQDADVVMFVYRDEYYDENTARPNIAEVNVAKHRNGPTGEADLYFDGKAIAFRNLAVKEL